MEVTLCSIKYSYIVFNQWHYLIMLFIYPRFQIISISFSWHYVLECDILSNLGSFSFLFSVYFLFEDIPVFLVLNMPKRAKTRDSSSHHDNSPISTKRVRYVPFARGFKPRNENARMRAAGYNMLRDVPLEYSVGTYWNQSLSMFQEFFNPVPHPTCQDDWLAQYDEDGQTFKQFLEENPWLSSRKIRNIRQKFNSKGTTICEKYPQGKVYILQLGKFDQCIKFSDLVDYASCFLCLPVSPLPPLDLEVTDGNVILVDDSISRSNNRQQNHIRRTKLNARYNAKAGHVQLRVDSVLKILQQLIPADALCLIALTTLDLYGDASDLFVAGMASGNQRVAVFSLLRYDPTLVFSKEHWYDLQTASKPMQLEAKSSLLLQRSCKLVVHEVMHLLGVDHCIFYTCCMNGSGHLAEDFHQPMHLCPVDLHKMHKLVGFDIRDRYKMLLEFYNKHSFKEEAQWVQKRLEYLSK